MLLQTLMPYLVIVGVAVLFFLVCCRIVLRKLKKMGRSIIVVTHDSELIKNSCDYVVRLKNR